MYWTNKWRWHVTKSDLVNALAESTGMTKTASEKTVRSIIESVTTCLKKGDKLTLVGFGTFSTSKRGARKGQNPQTGKKISIPATVSPKFKAGKALKDSLNAGKNK
jgi:DNA-binding protein HU-beta